MVKVKSNQNLLLSRNVNKNIDLAFYSTSNIKNMNDLKIKETKSWTS